MLTTNPAEILKGKYELLGSEALVEQIRSAVSAEVGDSSLRETLRNLGDDCYRLYYDVLADIRKGKLKPTNGHFHKLALMLDDVGVEFDVVTSLCPWSDLASSSRVVVLVADQRNGDSGLNRPSLAVSDARSEDQLRHIKNSLAMGFSVERELVPGDLTADEAGKLLDHWRGEPGVKMIVSTSSDQRNPVSAVIADRVARGEPLPRRFRWTKRPQRRSAMSSSKPGKSGEIGIETDQYTVLRRHVDEEFLGKSKRTNVRDCGLLLIDYASEPTLIVSAGHGGNGTLGCLDVLWQQRHDISHHLIKRKRGLAVVGVEMKKRPNGHADHPRAEDTHAEDLKIRRVWIEDWVEL